MNTLQSSASNIGNLLHRTLGNHRYWMPLVATACFSGLLAGTASAQSVPPPWVQRQTTKRAISSTSNLMETFTSALRPRPLIIPIPSRATTTGKLYDLDAPSMSLSVGNELRYPSLKIAWNYIKDARIAQGSTLTIRLITKYGSYNEDFPAAFSLNHPYGAAIQIIGDGATWFS